MNESRGGGSRDVKEWVDENGIQSSLIKFQTEVIMEPSDKAYKQILSYNDPRTLMS